MTIGEGGPDWLIVKYGLNIIGTCLNKACAAYQQEVIDPQGMATFVLTHSKCACPECGIQIQPETCGFYECSVSPLSRLLVSRLLAALFWQPGMALRR